MATLHCGGERLPLTFSNDFLARLQVAVHTRFGDGGGGFFLTGTVAGDGDGDGDVTASYWVPPGLPLVFGYDVRGEDGQPLPPVTVPPADVGDLIADMDRATGVRCSDSLWLPFTVG